MRITGTVHTIGGITICDHNTDPHGPEYDFQHIKGIIITTDDDDALRAASNLLCATVDIYPHPVDPAVLGHCTPQNYAHALARLAHAEDHLAREVRSSQSLARSLKDAEALITAIKADLQARVASDAEEARRRELAADAKAAAWVKYLDLRRQIRETPEDDDATIRALVHKALSISGEHDLDPTTLELEEARRTIDERERTITNMQGTINELVRQNDDLRAANDAHLVSRHALAAKQAEQERLMTAYRVQYHEADRALRKAEADLDALCTAKADEADEADDNADDTHAETNALAAQMAQDLEDERGREDPDFAGDDDTHEVLDKT
jgi:hypothetical protein